MAYNGGDKTEHGHRKDMAGKSWVGRKEAKASSKVVRRLKDKETIKKELKEI